MIVVVARAFPHNFQIPVSKDSLNLFAEHKNIQYQAPCTCSVSSTKSDVSLPLTLMLQVSKDADKMSNWSTASMFRPSTPGISSKRSRPWAESGSFRQHRRNIRVVSIRPLCSFRVSQQCIFQPVESQCHVTMKRLTSPPLLLVLDACLLLQNDKIRL